MSEHGRLWMWMHHMANVILDTTLDEGTTLDVACHEIGWLKLEVEMTKCHNIAQLLVANERHATKMENLQRELATFQMVHVVPTIKVVVDVWARHRTSLEVDKGKAP